MGIEPTWPAWKAGTLPLSYAREPPAGETARGRAAALSLTVTPETTTKQKKQMGEAGFEPAKAEPPDLQSGPFGRLGIHPSWVCFAARQPKPRQSKPGLAALTARVVRQSWR